MADEYLGFCVSGLGSQVKGVEIGVLLQQIDEKHRCVGKGDSVPANLMQ